MRKTMSQEQKKKYFETYTQQLETAMEAGNLEKAGDIQGRMAMCYATGSGVEKDVEKAHYLLAASAEKNGFDGLTELMWAHIHDHSVYENYCGSAETKELVDLLNQTYACDENKALDYAEKLLVHKKEPIDEDDATIFLNAFREHLEEKIETLTEHDHDKRTYMGVFNTAALSEDDKEQIAELNRALDLQIRVYQIWRASNQPKHENDLNTDLS